MILEKSREFTVNMGNYESMKIGARVTVEPKDMAHPSANFADLNDFADKLLGDALAKDVKEVSDLTHTRDSFVLSWRKE